jgi:polysaccharide export outer membrane protein
VISVPRAEMIYVVGQVLKAGGFILQERKDLSLLQALALAGGLDKNSAPKKAKILRPAPDGNRMEIAVNLPQVIAGKAPDLRLQPDDILFVPASNSKKVLSRVADVSTLASTALIYRIP